MEKIHTDDCFCHRDIKPQNLLKVGEIWKISDFGCIE